VPAACTVLIDDRHRLLLVKRRVAPKAGMWCLPGGFVESGEKPEQAAVRELREETGLAGRINALIGVTTSPGTFYKSILLLGYLVTCFSGSPVAGDDASDVKFFDINHLPDIAFESHQSFIRIYCSLIAQ
jgi:ADP-ribose pyrophosphatase YjhB (NUDIX family)